MSSTYYVYELVDPRNDRVFYVGKGKKDRMNAHEVEARKGVDSEKCQLIREIEAAGFSTKKRRVESFADEQEAFDFEASLICEYGLENLTNIIPGGGTPRSGPSIYRDRLAISACAEGVSLTRDGEICGITINGKYLDLEKIINASKERAAGVIERRGLEWANAIAARFRVTFSYG